MVADWNAFAASAPAAAESADTESRQVMRLGAHRMTMIGGVLIDCADERGR